MQASMFNFKQPQYMKKIIILLIFSGIAFIILPSCEDMFGDYLDKPPGVDVTQDTIFSSMTQVETAIAAMYRKGMHSIFPVNESTHTGGPLQYDFNVNYSDEGASGVTWTDANSWSNGALTPDNVIYNDRRWHIRFQAIRQANILLEKIDDVPGTSQAFVNQAKGDAFYIRALNYFEMFKRYGGVPILRESIKLGDDFMIPRSTLQETIDFIVEDCEVAMSMLPDDQPSAVEGSCNKRRCHGT
jgi:starch-binding outer membrane protein, SusD/RagB family